MRKPKLYFTGAVSVLAFLMSWPVPVHAQQDGMVLQGFRTRGRKPDGELAWELAGERALVKGALVHVSNVKLVLHGEKDKVPTVITSPGCEFNQDTQIVRSNDSIHVQGESFVMQGTGYDFIAATQTLTVRDNVCMILQGTAILAAPGSPATPGRDSANRTAADGPAASQEK